MNEILKNRRKELKLKVENLAENIGVKKSTIYEYEAGKRPVSRKKLIKLANALAINVDLIETKIKKINPKELEVKEYLNQGLTVKQIAKKMNLTVRRIYQLI